MKKKSADQIIKEIFTNYFKESGYSLDKKKSLHRFKERYGFSEYEESTQKVKSSRFLNSLKSFKDAYIKFLELIKDNLKNFMKYFVSISLGFSVAFVPVVNNTVRSYSESYLDKFYQFLEIMPIKEQIWNIPVDNNSKDRLNEIINLCIKDKIPFKVNQTPDSYRVTIEFIAFSENQLNLRNLIKLPAQFEGDYTLVISSK